MPLKLTFDRYIRSFLALKLKLLIIYLVFEVLLDFDSSHALNPFSISLEMDLKFSRELNQLFSSKLIQSMKTEIKFE